MKKEFEKRIISSIILIPLALFFIVEGSLLFNFFIFRAVINKQKAKYKKYC